MDIIIALERILFEARMALAFEKLSVRSSPIVCEGYSLTAVAKRYCYYSVFMDLIQKMLIDSNFDAWRLSVLAMSVQFSFSRHSGVHDLSKALTILFYSSLDQI
ncbi:hypothetical protein KP509_13G002700 [Ceratopteris richardii]|uniref:Uncharacterized protein n=1 Tax=Ceratopteris richardii TaxID=49495 RepID=A0A8T2TET9_CERRI|nr:hypothetical protein KP509_13G002700 [Ceratopteris richardii]